MINLEKIIFAVHVKKAGEDFFELFFSKNRNKLCVANRAVLLNTPYSETFFTDASSNCKNT